MNNLFGLRQTDLEQIISVLEKSEEIENAVIFGSRAKGNFSAGSDVDIALFGKHITPTNITRIRYFLNEESLMPYNFDVFDFNTLENKKLKEHIDRIGKIFYRKSKNPQLDTL